MLKPTKILISRTDSIGDVILTLPLAGLLKKHFPSAQLIFLGKNYTKYVIECCEFVDEFISIDELNKLETKEKIKLIKGLKISHCIHVFPVKEIAVLINKAKIPVRIGTTNRFYHWLTCNKLVKLSRKKSNLHEAQLNCKLLEAFGLTVNPSIEELQLYYGFNKILPTGELWKKQLSTNKRNVIIHAKSQGSAVEWGLDNFGKLISKIDTSTYKVFISGTQAERKLVLPLIQNHKDVIDITGQMNLKEFISFINEADILIAASTGPLHICAATGKKAIGLYKDIRPIHPGRWAPVGKDAHVVIMHEKPEDEVSEIIRLMQE